MSSMKKLLFIFIALFSYSTIIYASFPVTDNNIVVVDSNDQPTEAPEDCVDWALFAICLLFGWLGMHRFMTGDYLIATLQLLTMGGCGIWYIIDLFAIAMCKMGR